MPVNNLDIISTLASNSAKIISFFSNFLTSTQRILKVLHYRIRQKKCTFKCSLFENFILIYWLFYGFLNCFSNFIYFKYLSYMQFDYRTRIHFLFKILKKLQHFFPVNILHWNKISTKKKWQNQFNILPTIYYRLNYLSTL